MKNIKICQSYSVLVQWLQEEFNYDKKLQRQSALNANLHCLKNVFKINSTKNGCSTKIFSLFNWNAASLTLIGIYLLNDIGKVTKNERISWKKKKKRSKMVEIDK